MEPAIKGDKIMQTQFRRGALPSTIAEIEVNSRGLQRRAGAKLTLHAPTLFGNLEVDLMGCLFRSDADEKLARDLDAVRSFKLAQLALNFLPSLFTSGFAQLFDRSSEKGGFLQP